MVALQTDHFQIFEARVLLEDIRKEHPALIAVLAPDFRQAGQCEKQLAGTVDEELLLAGNSSRDLEGIFLRIFGGPCA
jgi:hypothetical protein